jgi:hypothetical protein
MEEQEAFKQLVQQAGKRACFLCKQYCKYTTGDHEVHYTATIINSNEDIDSNLCTMTDISMEDAVMKIIAEDKEAQNATTTA